MGGRFRELITKILAVFAGLIVALLLAEGLLRVLPVQETYVRIPLTANNMVGFTRSPNSSALFENTCYRIQDINFNSQGFRDKEFEHDRDFKIAILGDSFMEAIEVPVDLNTASILSKLLDCRTLNTGINSYGTTHELFVYKNFLKPLRPQIVLLFFYTGNDIKDNSCELTRMYDEPISGPCGYISNDKVFWETKFDQDDNVRGQSRVKRFLRQNCRLCLLGYRVLKFDIWNKYKDGEMPFLYNTFRAELPDILKKPWEEGWKITAEAIRQLNSEVKSAGGKLFIITVPDYFAVVPDWKESFRQATGLNEPPKDFDPLLAEKRLDALGKQDGIEVLNLAPYFNDYRIRFDLKDPYFWYVCDAHWSPLGHFLAANWVARMLLDNDAIGADSQERTRLYSKISKNLSLSPMDILGAKAYNQIYDKGVYLGSSNIPEILSPN
ncbi:MAG: hypothetical protein ACLQPD_09190 [Desulfomonilaceae bacterium]